MNAAPLSKNQNSDMIHQQQSFFRKCWCYLQGMIAATILLVLIVGGAWAWESLHNPKLFPFHHINFIGQFSHVSKTDLENVVQSQLNGGFFMLNVTKMRRAIQEVPWVDQVEIQRLWPDTLKIKISSQIPIARWGQNALINDRLQIFTPPANTIPKDLPVLSVPEKYISVATHYYVQIQAQLKSINLSIAALNLNARQSLRLTLSNGIEVILGQEQIMQRCHRLIHLYPRIIRANALDVASIDLRYPNGLAVKWKPKTIVSTPSPTTIKPVASQ